MPAANTGKVGPVVQEGRTLELGALIPLGDIGGDPAVVRDYAREVEAMGYDFLEAPDHVLGVNAGSRPSARIRPRSLSNASSALWSGG